jgi:hypothetical protein
MSTPSTSTSAVQSPPTPPAATTTSPEPFEEPAGFNPVALVLAFLLPGAGHAYLGEMRRARLVAAGVLSMFFGGLLIGGIDVVDRREDFVWFLGQALVGPIAYGTDYVHQNYIKVRDPGSGQVRSAHPYEIRNPRTGQAIEVRDPDTGAPRDFVDPRTGQVRTSTPSDRPPNKKSLGRVNEIGTLFATLAGMLNLICMIDAAFRRSLREPKGGQW